MLPTESGPRFVAPICWKISPDLGGGVAHDRRGQGMLGNMHFPLPHCYGLYGTPWRRLSPFDICTTVRPHYQLAPQVHSDTPVTTSAGAQTCFQCMSECSTQRTALLAYLGIVLTKHHLLGTSCNSISILPSHNFARPVLRGATHHRPHTMGHEPNTYMV